MKIILFLILISLLIAGGFLFAFFWAVRNGQYEDDYTPSMRILVDEDMIFQNFAKNENENKLTQTKEEDNV